MTIEGSTDDPALAIADELLEGWERDGRRSKVPDEWREDVRWILMKAGNLEADSSADDVKRWAQRVAEHITEADPLLAEVLTDRAAAHLDKLGLVRAPSRIMRAAVRGAGNGSRLGRSGADRTTVLSDPEPWTEPVEGPTLLRDLVDTFDRFLALPDGADAALALWTLHAHAHDAAQVSPVLGITSPEKRCGKTTLLELLGALVPKPLPASNITTAALFRSVEKYAPTLLVDEADTFMRGSHELRGVLNSGHSRRSAYVIRTVGDDFEPQPFRTWAPKAIALIGELPDTLADRAIEVRMRRRTSEEKVEKLRRGELTKLEPLRRRAWTWAQAHLEDLRDASPEVPAQLNDRAADNWRPLLAIADAAGGPWAAASRDVAVKLHDDGSDDDLSTATTLLEDLRDLFERKGSDRLPSREICQKLKKLEHRPWPEFTKRDEPITPRGLAKLLKPFGVEPKVVRIGNSTPRGYELADLKDPFRRYLTSSQVQQAQHPQNDGRNAGFNKCNTDPGVADSETDETPGHAKDVAPVADTEGGHGDREDEEARDEAPDGRLEEFDSAIRYGQ